MATLMAEVTANSQYSQSRGFLDTCCFDSIKLFTGLKFLLNSEIKAVIIGIWGIIWGCEVKLLQDKMRKVKAKRTDWSKCGDKKAY